MRNSFLFAFVLFCMIPAAFAQMDGDFSSGGAIMVGASTTTCDAAATGGIRYSGGVIQWCNGTAWANIASGSSGAIDDLTDAYTIYDAGVTSNFIMGRAGAAALTAGAQGNLFIGELAGATTAASTATTDFNTAVGYNVLTALTSGAYNTGMGSYSLSNVTSGLYNTAYGYKTLRLVTTGGFNAGIGDFVLEATTTGNLNSSVGSGSLKLNTTGSYNVAVGSNALASNVAKRESTAVGYQAIQYADDTATAAVTWNTAVGAYALRGSATASANTGTNNTAIGHSALLGNTSGSNSVAVGKNALTAATTGGTNTAVGSLAGDSITTGTGNIVIGYNVDTSAAGASNELNIGGTIYADLSTDKVGIGVVSPASALDVNGGVKIANDAAACVAGKAGTLRYTGGTPPWEYCNGSAWSPFEQAGCAGPADCSTVGSVCTDGSVFAGCVPPTFVTPFFATRCDAGQTWGGHRVQEHEPPLSSGTMETLQATFSPI